MEFETHTFLWDVFSLELNTRICKKKFADFSGFYFHICTKNAFPEPKIRFHALLKAY